MQSSPASHFSFAQSLHQRWFWVALLSIGYILAVNGAIVALGASVVLLSLPTALLPLIPAYMPPEKRFRYTVVMSILVYFTVIAIMLYTSYLPFDGKTMVEFGGKLFLTIPSFLIRGPLQFLLGYSKVLPLLSGAAFLAIFGVTLYRLPRLSDRSIYFWLVFVLVSMAFGMMECYELGVSLSYLGEGFHYDGVRFAS